MGKYNILLFSRHACYFYCIFLPVLLSIANAQDTVLTPPIGDRSKERRVEASSTCGQTGPETYCEFLGISSPPSDSLAPNCVSQICDNTCPHGVTSPAPIPLDEDSVFSSITTDTPATGQLGESQKFSGQSDSFVSRSGLPAVDNSLGFSFSTWVKVESGNNNGVIISRSSDTVDIEELFHLRVSGTSIHFSYLPLTSVTVSEFSIPSVTIVTNVWYHISVSIYQQDFAIYMNGVIQHATSLIANIKGPDGILYLGRDVNGTNSFTGSLDLPAYYSEALTEREAYSAYSGALSFLHLSPNCRCPPSHPVVSSTAPSSCTQHPGLTTNRGVIGRLNSNTHPPSYSNDNLTNSYWLSDPTERMVNITYILSDKLIEILFLLAVFDSPRPQSLVILKSSDNGITFVPLQYYSSDCLGDFGLVSGGQIMSASEAVCTDQFSTQDPVTTGLVSLDLFNASRPGASSFNTNAEFRDFVSVNQIRLSFRNYFNSSTTDQHLYYSLSTLTVAARCKCNGHTDSCIYSSTSSACQCQHNTQGDLCEDCQPLFNDKPWLFGVPCVSCSCNNHASVCTYNQSLDTNPSDRSASGGGVCVACGDNTQGRYCDECIEMFYRDVSKQIDDATACVPCDCIISGVTDQGLCSLDSDNNPQCNCKSNVEGSTCSNCKTGFFLLSASNPNGCTDCVCATDGTELGSAACDAVSGLCICKSNVQGIKCDVCKSGFTSLTPTNPDGCVSCGCNLIGSINNNCDPITSNCQCKPGVGSVRCDSCISGFHSFSTTGCQACQCNLIGSVNSICDAISGDCSCKLNVEGSNCDVCKDGFFDLNSFNTDGCISCQCDLSGTSFDSRSCNISTGVCSCKTNVQGTDCNVCKPGFFNLQSSNGDGCDSCQCNLLGTDFTADICNQNNGECDCISPATGPRCDSCSSGHFLSSDVSTLCQACACNSQTSLDQNCNTTTGLCNCRTTDNNGNQLGLGGRTCEECIEGFFQFSTTGCASCNCNTAGSEGTGCDQSSGVCVCKQNVEGTKCDTCKDGFGFLNANDPFGCSSVPTGLSPPTLSVLTSASISVSWQTPSSQSAIQFYEVTRNSTVIHQTTLLQFTDTNLLPYTVYTYTIIATNNAGSTESLGTSGRTLESIPTGVTPISFNAIQARSLQATWTAPTLPNGVITLFQVSITSVNGVDLGGVTNVSSGLALNAFISGLQPFTVYGFALRACNSAGCANSTETTVATLQAAPEQVSPPAASAITSDSLQLTWISPDQPNGVITGYTVFQRESPFTGQAISIGDLTASVLSFSVSGLNAFTQYEFAVSAVTSAGATLSEFVRITTRETAPTGVIAPILTVQGPTSVQITWQEPAIPNAASISYNIIRTAPLPSSVLISSSTTGSFQVFNLQPFTTYSFLLQVCNVAGCANSTVVTMTTDEQSPSGQSSPNAVSSSTNNISLEWSAPSQPNGIITSYTLSRRLPSLTLASIPNHEKGIRFHGAGYARFPTGSFNPGFSTTISFRVRTFSSTGLLMLFSTSSMSDYIAISFNESALQFAFDSGANSPTNIITLDVVVNDGAWHTITASRVGNEGSLTVNGSFSADNSVVGLDNEIASSALAFLGGIDSSVVLQNGFPVLSLNSLAGCLRDFEFNSDVIDFDNVESSKQVELSLDGCPSQIERGTHYPGAGFAKFDTSSINLVGDTFEISFQLKTLESTNLVLAIGENSMTTSSDYLLLSISSSVPIIDLQINGIKNTLEIFTEAVIDVCDGNWHTFSLKKVSTQFAFSVDDNTQTQTFVGSELLKLDSIFLGGIDALSPFYRKLKAVSLLTPNFGGCLRGLQLNGVALDYSSVSDILNVDIDGCPTVLSGGCTSASINDLVTGNVLEYTDVGLRAFSEYYYRVSSQNSAGNTVSNWQRANTQQGVPTAPATLQLSALSSSSIQASWTAPAMPNGVVDLYNISTTLNGLTVSDISVPDIQLQLAIPSLSPFTTYSVSVAAQLTSGAISAIISDTETTLQDVPTGVSPPTFDSIRSRDVTLSWQIPTQPNGIITSYSLIALSPIQSTVYTGDSNTLNSTVFSLSPYTEYQVILRVCTVIGCTDSSPVSFLTSEDIPEDMNPPSLIVLDSRRILVQWTSPSISNGVIISYIVLYAVSTDPSNTLISVTVNATMLELTVSDLQPATEYQFSVRATNNIGSITSDVTTNSTLHDVPEEISPPSISVVTAFSLTVVWQPPETPNGDIINYKLLVNQSEVFSGLQLQTTVTGLLPFTSYILRIQACTIIGCGTSDSTQTITLEAAPVGLETPSLTSRTPTTLTIQIQPAANPNGLVLYTLYAMGVFDDSNGEEVNRIVHNSADSGQVVVESLLPFYSYTVYLDVNNTVGGIRSEVLLLQTLGIAPEGLSAPTLLNSTSTSLSVMWSAASLPNGIIHTYLLYGDSNGLVTGPVIIQATENLIATLSNLRPATVYAVYVVAINQFGNGTSDVSSLSTLESVPEDQPAPTTSLLQSRSVHLTWIAPSTPNGQLVQFNIIQNGTELTSTNPDTLNSTVTALVPFTLYRFAIEACTAVGCFRSDEISVKTLEDVPENLTEPRLVSDSPTSVIIRWDPPTLPNGILQSYSVERSLPPNTTVTQVVTLNANATLVYIDSDSSVLKPYLLVSYRVVVVNGAGSTASLFTDIRTLQAPPAAIQTPTVTLPQPTAIQVIWLSPDTPNGVITEYIFKYFPTNQPNLVQSLSLLPSIREFTQQGLVAYENYSISITACTVGGCTESEVVVIETGQVLPTGFSDITVEVLSANGLLVSWLEPAMPNGLISEYILYRREEGNSYVEITRGLFLLYNDSSLLPFHEYQYSLEVANGAGTTPFGNTNLIRTLPASPLAGATLNASTTTSSIVLLQWDAPGVDVLRGEIVNFEVVGYQAGSEQDVTSLFNGTDTMFSVTQLNPSTNYVFKVILFNGVGYAESNTADAKTLDGAPKGVYAPILTVINSTAIQVEWLEPLEPNGVIVSYNVLLDGVSVHTDSMSGVIQLTGLIPFTNYTFQLVACTRFQCTQSNTSSVLTLQAPPTGFNAPDISDLQHNSFFATWASPAVSNGDITSYTLYLRYVIPCSQSTEQDTCDYLECPLGESRCGSQCYTTSTHVCCDNNLHAKADNHSCCAGNYIERASPSDVCCGGNFYTFQNQFSCCGGVYQTVAQGSVCCTDGDVAAVGAGDTCCGTSAFTDSGSSMCCGSSIVSQHINTMCCGGVVVSAVDRVCCNGAVYDAMSGYVCCDTSYESDNVTLCCAARNGVERIISYSSPEAKSIADEKCCDVTPIPSQLSCCNNRAYNPQLETCADRSTSTGANCGTGVTCPNSQANTAYCNKCDFPITTYTCDTIDLTSSNTQTCYETIPVFTGFALSYNVTSLTPFTPYLVYAGVSNSAGETISSEASIQTLESTPVQVNPPTITVLSYDVIQIEWTHPSQPNGIIIHFRVNRDSQEIAIVNDSTIYIDSNLSPFTLYSYTLSACTSVGCSISTAVSDTTFESLPIGLAQLITTQITATTIELTWSAPASPNGIIQNYTIYDAQNNIVFSGTSLATTITGLLAFIEYTYTLQACNSIGCVLSLPTTFTTSEVAPMDIEPPITTIIRFDVLEIRWSPPNTPNGIIQYYLLRKNDVIILNTTNLTYTDTDVFASTMYRYTIEAFNNVGSIVSGAATVSTPDSTPSGLDPPVLTAVNATAILIEWIPPTLPNGDIIQYDLYQDNVNFITLTDTTLRSYIRTGLTAYTQYSFRVAACTRSGCAISNTVQVTTLEAPPSGLNPPFLLALTSSSLRVSWQPPAVLNGILTGYEVLQTTLNQPPVQIPVPSNLYTIDIDNLNAFTLYTYTVKARNSAGSVTSDEASVRTLEDFPMLFNAPTISSVLSRSLTINWGEPTKPNGIIILYYIYARIITTPLNPIPINRDPVLLLTVNGNVTTTTIQNLEPGSSYEFRMAANNSIGQVITTWVPATTAEDRPELLQPIMYTADPSGTSLSLFWNEPLKPNGIINMYLIYLGINAIFRGVSNSFTYRLLTPFTAYELYLQACTTAGCTSGELQVITTAEIAPENQNVPLLDTLGPSSIRITWQPPFNPNGIIIRYRIQRENPDSSISQIHTVLNTTLRTFIDTGLLSYSVYNYAVTAENSVGSTQSDFVSQRTDEGVPEGLDAPNVQPILSTEILILWSSPSSPNGIITSYEVIRDGNTIISLSSFQYRDRNLDPYTDYSYQIIACNSRGGCVTSIATGGRTLESIPQGVIAPSLTAVSFSQVEVRWDPPTQPNGVIQQYMLTVNDVDQTEAISPFTYTQSNLLPYTIYRIAIIACTSIGCGVGPTSNILTLEYIPSGQFPPLVSVTSSKSTSVSWDVPSMPNGIIIGYDVIRNGNVVLFTNNTQDRVFTDTNLRPAMSYTYSIRAYTSIGASDASQGTVIITSPDAPELLQPPTLTPLTSTSFKAEWSAPQIPNGMITRYDLLIDNKVNFTGLLFEYTVTLLEPFTQYNVIIRACTTTCTDSQVATVVTNSDTPVDQAVPTLSAYEGPSVLIEWQPPDKPNGIITEYRVFRRELFIVNGQTTFSDEIIIATVYSQLFTFDNTTELKLFTNYQYKVVSVNSVGQAISEWGNILTVQGIPQNVVAPEFLSSIHTSITLTVLPPQTPNGIITSYIVYRDEVQVAELTGSDNTTTVSNLLPYTLYQISITACTIAGCNTSATAALRTGEYTPEDVAVPLANLIQARQIAFTWNMPAKPNGLIISYSILAQPVCPQPPQPHINPGGCQYGAVTTVYTGDGDQLFGTAQGLTPYVTYQFFLVATNSHSAQQSSPSIFYTTESAIPEMKNTLSIRRLCNTVTVDWSDSFHLNGLLKNFEFLVNSNLMDSTTAVTKTVGDLIYGTPYEFKVKAITSIGSAEQANFVLIETAPHCIDPSSTTLSPTSNVTVTPTAPITVGSLGGIVLIIVAITFLLVLFFCFFAFCVVILSSRKERDKYRTQSRIPLLAATNSRMDDPISDLTLQESLMLENRSNTLDLSLPRSKLSGSIANSSISYGNSIRTPPSARYSPRLTQLDRSTLKQSSDIDFSQDESGFRDTRL